MASSTATTPTVDVTAGNAAQSAPRKRRRRTAATGAAEDCFTCRKRQIRCDRKRPYCSQCLEIGKDCSGYRTALTWGVGVASRGKLRGLSLPIVNSTKKASDADEGPKGQSSPRAKPAISPMISPAQTNKPKTEDSYQLSYHHHGSELSPAAYSPGSFHPTSPIPIPIQQTQHGWHVPGFREHVEGYNSVMGKPTRLQVRPGPLRRAHTTATGSYEEAIFSAPSTASVSTFSESDFPSPNELPPTPEEMSIVEPYINSYPDAFPCPPEQLQSMESYSYLEAPRSYHPTTTPYTTPTMSTTANSQSCFSMMPPSPARPTFSDLLHCNEFPPVGDMGQQFSLGHKVEQEYFSDGFSDFSTVSTPPTWTAPLPPTRKPSGLYHLPPRMQFLLGYYDKAICPVLVAFDNERNPYRMHVMPLAASTSTAGCALQNAIAALAINNIRMRGLKEGNGLHMEYFGHMTASNMPMHNEPTSEEVNYKSTSVSLFNDALKDSSSANDDSILATLLILCLFHVSDGGFTSFKTQLTGVKRLLSMRDCSGGKSAFLSWAESWFIWFDLMTSTVTDREAQTRPGTLDMLDLSANLGTLEHLASCDGRLYKLIARLGRLNSSAPTRDYFTSPHTPRTIPVARPTKDYHSLDGNGWGSPLSDSTQKASERQHSDARQEFWNQFLHVRARLSSWVSHPQYANMPRSETDTISSHNITEIFRYSAAIYAERLASPSLPPSSPHIQTFVSIALRHIGSIANQSSINTFLLWPLLVIGTEAITIRDRDLIRQRVASIAPGCFFNNFSCLDVLERVWVHDDGGEGWHFVKLANGKTANEYPNLSVLGGQVLRWDRALYRLGGDFLVL